MAHKEDSGDFIGHQHCIGSEIEGKTDCDSSDALAIHKHEDEDGNVYYDAYCYSCNQFFNKEQVHSSSLASYLGIKDGLVVEHKNFPAKQKSTPLTREEAIAFRTKIGFSANMYRGIKDEYNKFFEHLTKLDSNGKVLARYYPETKDGNIVGYKCRNHPKDFRYGKLGLTGIGCDLSGQFRFKSGGKYVLILAGEEDKVAAYQMLKEDQMSRGQGDYESIACVSPTTGEGSAYKQIANNYDFFDSFEVIVIGMDNDEVGREAAQAIAKVLPADKVRIATWSMKDPNEMLLANKQKQFVRNFYNAKPFIDVGIKTAADAMAEVNDFLMATKINLPPHLHRLQTNMRGGIRSTGAIVNIIGDTSIGKSFFTDTLLYHWIFNSPIKPTVLSLERTAGELLADLYSIHLKKNLTWFQEGSDAVAYLDKPEVKALCDNLVYDESGVPRFFIIDERSASIESLKKQVDKARKQYGSSFIINDPLTDWLRSLPTEDQEDFMLYEKLLKKDGVVFINVLHTRKPPTDKEGKVRKTTEFDALGSGSFVQSADINIVINRNKMAEDPVERNTTTLDMPKCRGGITGHACDLYYDPETRQAYDKDDFFNTEPITLTEDGEVSDIQF